MHHLAIMRKDWKLIEKIVSGEKTIESRWYKAKVAPWNRIAAGDIVWFKDSGMPVSAKAEVESVLQFENYSEEQLRELLGKYHGPGKICFTTSLDEVFSWAKKRKYCILMFLKNPMKVKPFEIDKTGYGTACAWICVDDISRLKR